MSESVVIPLRSRRRLGSRGTEHPRDGTKTARANGHRFKRVVPGRDRPRRMASFHLVRCPPHLEAHPAWSMDAQDAIALGHRDAQRSSCSRPSPGRGRVLRWDGRRGWGAGLRRLPCRRRLAALRRRAQDRRRPLQPTGVSAVVSRAFRRSPRRFVCGFLANASQIRSERRHRDRHAPLREHRGDSRPAVALRAKGEDLGRQRANRLLLAQLGFFVRRNVVERLLQLQNRLRCELVLVVHRFSLSLHEHSLWPVRFPTGAWQTPVDCMPLVDSRKTRTGSQRAASRRPDVAPERLRMRGRAPDGHIRGRCSSTPTNTATQTPLPMARPTVLAVRKGIQPATRRSQPHTTSRTSRSAAPSTEWTRARVKPLRARVASRPSSHRAGQRLSRLPGPRWSVFAAHPWSLINDHQGRARRFGESFPRPFTAPRAPRCSWARGIALAECAPYARAKRSRTATA